MKNSRKLISLLLVAILTFSMVVGIAAEEVKEPEVTIWFAKTSGGLLNLWAGPVKTFKTNIAKIPNGRQVTHEGESTYSKADKTTMVKVSYDGKTGWVDARFLGKKVVKESDLLPPPPPASTGSFMARANTTGGKLNVWEKPNFTGKKLLTVKNGTVLGMVETFKGMPYAEIVIDGQVGYVRVKYLAKVVPPKPEEEPEKTAEYDKAVVVGTAPNSIINFWKDTAKNKKHFVVPVGTVLMDAWTFNDGWTEALLNVGGKDILGYVMTKYLKLIDKTWPVPAPTPAP